MQATRRAILPSLYTPHTRNSEASCCTRPLGLGTDSPRTLARSHSWWHHTSIWAVGFVKPSECLVMHERSAARGSLREGGGLCCDLPRVAKATCFFIFLAISLAVSDCQAMSLSIRPARQASLMRIIVHNDNSHRSLGD